MTDAARLEELRRLFLSAPESSATRILAIVISTLLVIVVLRLVRRRELREEYTPIWIAVAVANLILSAWPALLHAITRAIGAWTPSSTIFFLGELFLVAICLSYGVRLSRANLQLKNLAQEVALLRADLDAERAVSQSRHESGEGA
jgi:hypothetical protein